MNKYYYRQSISERLVTAEGAISIVQEDPELAEALRSVGFAEEQFADGTQRLEAASERETEQEVQLGAQVAATERVKELYRAIRRYFKDDRQLVRTATQPNYKLYVELRLHLRMEESRSASIRQMVHFYYQVVHHPDVVEALARQHVSADRFTVRREELNALVQAMQERQHLEGKAIVATQMRREAMEDLDAWMKQFIRRARVALEGNEEQLRKLGIRVKVKE